MSIYKKPSATYVASVRCDLRDVASIALFFNNRGETLPTQTALVNMGVKMMGQFFQSRFPVRSYSDAIATLRNLGYGDPLKKGTRYFRGLLKELGKEELAGMNREMQSSADRSSPAAESEEVIQEKLDTIQDIMQKDQLGKPRLPTKESIEGADVVAKTVVQSEEEPQAPLDLSQPKTRMTQEDIEESNAKNARDTADMRKGLKVGIIAEDK